MFFDSQWMPEGKKNVTSGVIRRHFIAKEFRRVAIRIAGPRLFELEAPLHHGI